MNLEVYKKTNIVHAIFQEAHGEADFSGMLRLVDHPELQPDGFLALTERMDADPSYFYHDPNAVIYQFLYYKDFFFHQFHFLSLSMEDSVLSTDTHGGFSEVARFKAQREWLTEKLENDVELFLQLSEKKVRFNLYIQLFDRIPDKAKFDAFLDIYTQSEYGFDRLDPEFVRKVFSYREQSEEHIPFRESFPDAKEYITLYRGATDQSTPLDKTYSWTLNKEVAKYFANRWGSRGTIYQTRVKVDNIIAYLDGRNEEEVLVSPEHVRAWKSL